MTDRRYSDEEIAEIFKRAAEAEPAPLRASGGGMSLAELQSIGAEVGIPADRVASAARSLELTPRAASMRLIGLPVSVRESVELERRLTDDEWNEMVGAARETFAARGKLRSEGEFREWTNGNLAMMLEPTATGHRIRFQTRHTSNEAMLRGGATAAVFGATLSTLGLILSGPVSQGLLTSGPMMMGIGVVLAVMGAVRLPAWARRRSEQMRQLAAKAKGMTENAST